MNNSKHNLFRYFYYEYRAEIVFGLALTSLVALSYILSPLIPTHIFQACVSPVQTCAITVLSGVSTWCLARHHQGSRLRKICACIMGALTAIFIYGYYIRLKGDGTHEVTEGMLNFEGWEMVFGNVIAWLLLAYPSELLRPGWLTWKNALTRLLPVIFIGVIDYFVPWDLRWLLAIVPAVWVGLLFHHVREYHRYCEQNFSSLEETDEHWVITYLIMVFVMGCSYAFLTFSDVPNRLFTQQWLMFFILFYSNDQVIFRSTAWIERVRVENEDTKDDDAAKPSIYAESRRALEQWMETDKPYLNPDFRLTDLMQVLPMNRTYLSQFINAEYDCTFYQFVTNYRVEEAKRLMSENPQLKMQDVADRCGFSSATVFGRIFARETGFTPTEWLAQPDKNSTIN